MSSTLNAALINNANLEKQLFLERESKAEFQKAVKREVVSMKKKAFVTEKRIADSQLAMKRALAECKKILSALDAPGLAKMSSNRGLQEIRSSAEAMSLSISEALGTAVLQKTASSLGYVASASDVSAGGEEEASPRFGPSSPMDMPVPQLESGISDMVIDEGEEDVEDDSGSLHMHRGGGQHLTSSPPGGGGGGGGRQGAYEGQGVHAGLADGGAQRVVGADRGAPQGGVRHDVRLEQQRGRQLQGRQEEGHQLGVLHDFGRVPQVREARRSASAKEMRRERGGDATRARRRCDALTHHFP
jgi:hypothetical protein